MAGDPAGEDEQLVAAALRAQAVSPVAASAGSGRPRPVVPERRAPWPAVWVLLLAVGLGLAAGAVAALITVL